MFFRFIRIFTFISILFGITFSVANAVTCQPPFNGNRTVEANCTYPAGGIKVYGNITVGNRTVTVPNGRVLGINLGSNRVTFTSGKILFSGSAKMDNSVSTRNFITVSYSSSSNRTNCPSGYRIANTAGTAYQGSSVTNVPTSGTIKCGKL